MQVGLFDGQDHPFEKMTILANINSLIAKARKAGAPIFFIQHTGPKGSPCERGSQSWNLVSSLEVNPKVDYTIEKTTPSCFLNTGLQECLMKANIQEIVITGMKTQYCIDTTCRNAFELGFKPILIADAHTCMDTPILSAKKIIEHHNATLCGPFARLANTHDFEFAV